MNGQAAGIRALRKAVYSIDENILTCGQSDTELNISDLNPAETFL